MKEHKYLLRVPVQQWDELKVAASKSGRSVNSEILWRIAGGLSERGRAEVAGSAHSSAVAGHALAEPDGRSPRSESFRPDFKRGAK